MEIIPHIKVLVEKICFLYRKKPPNFVSNLLVWNANEKDSKCWIKWNRTSYLNINQQISLILEILYIRHMLQYELRRRQVPFMLL